MSNALNLVAFQDDAPACSILDAVRVIQEGDGWLRHAVGRQISTSVISKGDMPNLVRQGALFPSTLILVVSCDNLPGGGLYAWDESRRGKSALTASYGAPDTLVDGWKQVLLLRKRSARGRIDGACSVAPMVAHQMLVTLTGLKRPPRIMPAGTDSVRLASA